MHWRCEVQLCVVGLCLGMDLLLEWPGGFLITFSSQEKLFYVTSQHLH